MDLGAGEEGREPGGVEGGEMAGDVLFERRIKKKKVLAQGR